jgi:hypothetical protein
MNYAKDYLKEQNLPNNIPRNYLEGVPNTTFAT